MGLRIESKENDPETLVLYWDEETWRFVNKPLFINGLRKIPSGLPWEEFLSQFTALEQKVAKRYAIWLLSRRIYLSSALTDKLLSKGISSKIAQEIIVFCQARGYLDDSQEIARLIAKEQRKGFGVRAIFYKLKSKGIDEALIRPLLENITGTDQKALKQCLEKYGKKIDLDDRAARNKLIAKLARRGFSPDLVIKELGDI